ncbi:MAG: 50S ribosomal protein L11 methyltransferase [Candidatus Algichlamydia australiensis]|nr:50S ribosomal protein L11 methyltransferase [Chlamydiales bacterium]
MDLSDVNWEEQWQAFAPGFKDGILQVEVGEQSLSLVAGGGFGDLSHPTTRLMLQLLPYQVKNRVVIDIGCGSGILSVAAAKLGAKKVYGLDICEEARRHTRANAKCNGVQIETFEKLEKLPKGELLILMNMISSEQEVAWQMNSCLHNQPAIWITSGILEEQHREYLGLLQSWNLHFTKREVLEGWSCYVLCNRKFCYSF